MEADNDVDKPEASQAESRGRVGWWYRGAHRASVGSGRVRRIPLVGVGGVAVLVCASVLPVALAPQAWAAPGVCRVSSTGVWRTPSGQAYVVTSPFGDRLDPVTQVFRLHAGVDLAMLPGPGPVLAASAGTVLRAGPYGGLGNEVTVDNGGGVQTLYGHLSRVTVSAGQRVVAGQQLGVEGSTGQSTGDHLHFEVHVNGVPVDPVPFMAARGVPLDGTVHGGSGAGRVGAMFALPAAGAARRASLTQPPLPIPARIGALYRQAGARYGIPWQLLAGIGMEETGHGRNDHRSGAGALGLMQFLPSTFARYGVAVDHPGAPRITDDADSIFSAAHALVAFGVRADGAQGVRDALFAYNPAGWYVGDVLYYARAYGGGAVDGAGCVRVPGGAATVSSTAGSAAAWARARVGQGYRFGANGPATWDASSFVQAAYAQAGVRLPRTAQQQQAWLASGHGTRVAPGDERPGDLIFENSYLGPDRIGFVLIVTDPARQQGVAARNPRLGVTYAGYAGAQQHRHIFQIWRVTTTPTSH